jgi:hypothetical protein
MLHPSSTAVDYIWEKFSSTYFDKPTEQVIAEYHSIYQALQHRPFNSDSDTYRTFYANTQEKLALFRKRFPLFFL